MEENETFFLQALKCNHLDICNFTIKALRRYINNIEHSQATNLYLLFIKLS